MITARTVVLTPGKTTTMAKGTTTEVVLRTTALDIIHPYTHVAGNWREERGGEGRERGREGEREKMQ
jgi:hypothetical protein